MSREEMVNSKIFNTNVLSRDEIVEMQMRRAEENGHVEETKQKLASSFAKVKGLVRTGSATPEAVRAAREQNLAIKKEGNWGLKCGNEYAEKVGSPVRMTRTEELERQDSVLSDELRAAIKEQYPHADYLDVQSIRKLEGHESASLDEAVHSIVELRSNPDKPQSNETTLDWFPEYKAEKAFKGASLNPDKKNSNQTSLKWFTKPDNNDFALH